MPTHGSEVGVLVGVDRTPEALEAARYALREARAQRCGLLLVNVVPYPTGDAYFAMDDLEAMCADGASVLDEVVAVLRSDPGSEVPITTLVRQGSASMVLADLSPRAQGIVVGRRDSGWGERLLTGSVSSRVSADAACPVITVPHGWNDDEATNGRVVVALDGKSAAHDPLRYAFAAAGRRHVDLVVLHADPDREAAQEIEGRDINIAEVLAGWRSEYPDIAVMVSTAVATATAACEDASRDASLLVVGRSSDRRLLAWTRSVARAVLRNARCPVVTVPLPETHLAPEQASSLASFVIPTY